MVNYALIVESIDVWGLMTQKPCMEKSAKRDTI